MMHLPYSEELGIEFLSRIFDKKSESYKLFWFQAIVNQVIAGKDSFTYNELINEMIADAWYMVNEYKLNFGYRDGLKLLIEYIASISGMKASEKKRTILEYLNSCTDNTVNKQKRDLTYQVPYRLQAPFLDQVKGKEAWAKSEAKLAYEINKEKRLIYYFSEISGLNTTIQMQNEWCIYILKNQEILKGWIQYHLIIYLQKRNPHVPGIADKLNPPEKRKLSRVVKYWKTIIKLTDIHEIYENTLLTDKNLSIDHFVPWSYVAHDEFWNLHPTTRSINSSKNNKLPDWNKYSRAFCEVEFQSYKMMWKSQRVQKEFNECRGEHVNSDDIAMKLYRKGLSKQEFCSNLKHTILPVYESAKNAGFGIWRKDL